MNYDIPASITVPEYKKDLLLKLASSAEIITDGISTDSRRVAATVAFHALIRLGINADELKRLNSSETAD